MTRAGENDMAYLTDRYLSRIEDRMTQLEQEVYTPLAPLTATAFVTEEPVPYEQRMCGRYVELKPGEAWSHRLFDCAWFHFSGVIPEECEGRETVMLLDVSGEGLIVDEAGNPVQGITCVDSEFDYRLGRPGKWIYPWAKSGHSGAAVDFWMDAGNNDLFGKMQGGILRLAQIAVLNRACYSLYYDLAVLVDYLKCTDRKRARYNQVLFALYRACLEEDNAMLSLTAQKLLAANGGDAALTFTATGHAHMDLAWLWPIRETKRKGARTFSTALSLMERYPDYVFGASQPQLYAWIRESYPALYDRVKEKVREGRFEPQGSMWVEADTNLPGGESLVRQILYGKRFFQEEFHKDVRVLWLPDAFGYSGALPQILLKSGHDAFMTQKLSWNQHNRFPHHSFRWKGIDGSEIFTHMLPEETYNSPLLPRSLRYAEENYEEKGITDEAMILFGIGDGGGGPGEMHLEAARRVHNLFDLCPVRQGNAQETLIRIKQASWDLLPVWQGELYLERHQGTYTTAAQNKWYNRKLELALRDLELLGVLCGKDLRLILEPVWKEVLLYQFHDILPGSSIRRVYEESQARYALLLKTVRKHTELLLAQIGRGYVNTLSWERTVIREDRDGFWRVTVPAMGYTGQKGERIEKLSTCSGPMMLENRFLKAVFDQSGALISCLHKASGLESVSAPSNRYTVWQDQHADSWDIAIEYTDRKPEYFMLDKQQFMMEGAEAICRQTYRYGNSRIELDVRLGEDDEYLSFDMDIDWQQEDVMLRTAFHSSVITDRAGFEIQFGHVHRTNHENTSWDMAQFEVCAHKWVDLSETDWGTALLNDCKYGFRVRGQTIDMNLLRNQRYPGEYIDRGSHKIRYAWYPHTGDIQKGNVTQKAWEFNCGLLLSMDGKLQGPLSLVRAVGLVVETVKQAEDGRGWILRAYEHCGTHAAYKLELDKNYLITPCDLVENPIGEAYTARQIQGTARPFEIMNWRMES